MPSLRALPPVAIFLATVLGLSLALASGAYLLAASGGSAPIEATSVATCAPIVTASGLPGTFTVSPGTTPVSFDRVEARWTLANGSLTPWRPASAFLDGIDGVLLTDRDASGMLSPGDSFTVSGGAQGGELRCSA